MATFSRDGRDYYVDPEGKLVSVDAGFDALTEYPGLAPATKEDVDARAYEKAQAAMQGPSLRDDAGMPDADAVFGTSTATPEAVEEFVALPPTEPEGPKPFSRDGRDYYVSPDGKLHSVDAGFDAASEYDGLVPATAEQVHARDIQKRSGTTLGDKLRTLPETALATTKEAISGVHKAIVDPRYHPDPKSQYVQPEDIHVTLPSWLDSSGEDIAPVHTPEVAERREANPTMAFLGAAVPDVAANFVIPGQGVRSAAARILASSIVTEAGDAVIEGHEFEMSTALGVWAPTQLAFEAVGGRLVSGVAQGLGWSRNALNNMVERSRSSAVTDALREVDPVKRSAKLVKEAPHVYAKAQTELDEALSVIDERMPNAGDKLFTPSALKKTISNNVYAQLDTFNALVRQVSNAAEVAGDAALVKSAKELVALTRAKSVREGRVFYRALREQWQALSAAQLENPLAREALESIEKTLGDENVWGRAAQNHVAAMAETGAVGSVRGSVRDVATHATIGERLDQARRVASLTGDTTMRDAAKKAAAALELGGEVTGARIMSGKATTKEVDVMRKTLDSFVDKAPKVVESVTKGLEALKGVADDLLPDTWPAERVEAIIVGRAAGSAAARAELDKALAHAEAWIVKAKDVGTESVAKIARAESQVNKLRAALDEVDQLPKMQRMVTEFDANPQGLIEKGVDKLTGAAAQKVARAATGPIAGAAAGYAGGGIGGMLAGGVAGAVGDHFVEPVVKAQADRFKQWVRTSLRKRAADGGQFSPWLKDAAGKYGKPLAGVAAIYGANRLAENEQDASPNAAAAVAMFALPLFVNKAGRKLSLFDAAKTVQRLADERGLKSYHRDRLAHELFGETAGADTISAVRRILEEGRFDVATNNGRRDAIEAIEQRIPNIRERLDLAEADFDPRARRLENDDHFAGYESFEVWRDDAGRKLRLDIQGTIDKYAGNFDYPEINAIGRRGASAVKELEERFYREALEEGEGEAFARSGAKVLAKERVKTAQNLQRILNEAVAAGITLPGTTYRGILFRAGELERLRASQTVEAYGFMSTSVDREYAEGFVRKKRATADPGLIPTLVEVRQRTGVPIQAGEGEVLLRAGTKFGVSFAPDGTLRLTEVEVHGVKAKDLAKDRDRSLPWVAGGLLAIGAADAASDDEGSDYAAAGVGGLYLLFGGKKAAAQFASRSAAAMGRLAVDLGPQVAKATDEALEVFTKDAVELAAKGEVVSKMTFAGMVDGFKSNLFDQIGWRVGETVPLTPELESEVGRYANAWADKTFAEYAGSSRADDILDGESIMWSGEGTGQLGSNEGGTYRGGDGVKRYVKLYDSEQQAVGEHMANQIYRQAGIPAPRSALFRTEEDRLGYASEWLKGGFDKKRLDEITDREAREFVKGFWGDVLLANWDVTGMHHDNLVFPFSGGVYRIDNGSALKYRARGAEKPAHLLEQLSEIDGFFDPNKNRPYAALLRKAGVNGPKELAEYLPETLEGAKHYLDDPGPNADPELLGILRKRYDLLADYADQLEAQRAVRRPTRLGDVVTKAPRPMALKTHDDVWFNNNIAAKLRRAPSELASRSNADQARYFEHLAEETAHRIEQRFADDIVTRRAVDKFTREQLEMLKKNLALEATLTEPPRLPVQLGESALAFEQRLEAHMQAAKELLTPKELDAVRSFTGGSSGEIKAAMSGAPFRDYGSSFEKIRDDILPLVPHLDSAAQKLMFPTPTVDTPLYRGVNVPEAALHELLTVNRYSPASTLSTSNSVNVAREFARGDERKVLLRFVHVEEAAPVMHVSHMPHESEWFIPRGGAYDIQGRYYDQDRDLFVIDLAQVEPASKPDLTNAGALAVLLGIGAAATAGEGDESGAAAAGVGMMGLGAGKGLRVPRLGAGAKRGATAGAKQLFLRELKSAAEEDREEAERIEREAEEQAAAINEEREQALDHTREKLGYLSHQGRTLMQTTARQLASRANDNDRVVERMPGVTASAGVARFLGTAPSLREAFEEKRQALATLQRDPMALVDELTESFAELQDNAPELHAQVTAQTFKVAQYLQSKLPGTIGASLTRPEGTPPNSLQLRQFALYYASATDPSSVLTDLANNRARKEQVDTLRELWPETYQGLKVAIVEQLSQGRPTFAQRSRLDLLFDFGDGFDRALSPGLVAVLDARRQAQGGPGGAGGPGGKQAPSRRTQPSVGGTGALGSLALGAAAGPGTLA